MVFPFLQGKLDMALSVKPWHSSYHLSLWEEIISMKNPFWEICLRCNNCFQSVIIIFCFFPFFLFLLSFSCLCGFSCSSFHFVLILVIYDFLKQYYQCGVEMIRRDLLTGHWKPYLEHAISLKPCYEGGINGGEVLTFFLDFCDFLDMLFLNTDILLLDILKL